MTSLATRQLIIKLHLIVAAFMFPAIVMFLGTGALYTWGNTGEYVDTKHSIALSQPLSDDKDALKKVAAAELTRLGIAPPSGSPSVRKLGDAYRFEWSGANRDVYLEPTDDAAVGKLTVKETTTHRRLVQLHKAKGTTAFKLYASVLAGSLLLLVISGLIVSLTSPVYRRLTIITAGLGALAFAGAVTLG